MCLIDLYSRNCTSNRSIWLSRRRSSSCKSRLSRSRCSRSSLRISFSFANSKSIGDWLEEISIFFFPIFGSNFFGQNLMVSDFGRLGEKFGKMENTFCGKLWKQLFWWKTSRFKSSAYLTVWECVKFYIGMFLGQQVYCITWRMLLLITLKCN